MILLLQAEIFRRIKKSVATNPQAAGQTKISFQISDEEKAVLQKLADASGMKLSAYIRKVLIDAVATSVTYSTERKTFAPPVLMAAEDQAPYGKEKPRPGNSNDQAS